VQQLLLGYLQYKSKTIKNKNTTNIRYKILNINNNNPNNYKLRIRSSNGDLRHYINCTVTILQIIDGIAYNINTVKLTK